MEQAHRLYGGKVYGDGGIQTDGDGFIRLDDLEMKPETQAEVMRVWDSISTESLARDADFEGYRTAFLQLFGFEVPGVDYDAEVDPVVDIPTLIDA